MKNNKLSDILLFAPKSKLNASQGLESGKFPFYSSSQLVNKRTNNPQYKKNALIIGTGGSANIHFSSNDFSTTSHCSVLYSKDESELNIKYVYYFLKSNIHILEQGFKGIALKNLSKSYLMNIEIPILDIEEQKRIVTILDKVQSVIDKREEGLLKLVELQRSIFAQMFGEPIFNTYNWNKIKLRDVIRIDAGWSPVCLNMSRNDDSQIGILKQSAITKGYFIPNENKLLPSDIPIKKTIYAQKDTLLFSRKNTKNLVGSTIFLFEDYKNLLIPDTIFKINYDTLKISGVYLSFLFNDLNFNNKIKDLSSGAVESMVNISQNKLLDLEIIYPDYDIQLEFEKKIRKIQENLLVFLKKSESTLSALISSLFQQIFRVDISYNIDTELESLLNLIDVEKKDSENDITTLSKDRVLINRLLDRIKSQDFKDIWLYDKAKYALFRIMNDNKDIFQHEFDIESESINTRMV